MRQQMQFYFDHLSRLPVTRGLAQDMQQNLEDLRLLAGFNTLSLKFLVHLNAVMQCHDIASLQQLHVSRWLAQRRLEHRAADDQLAWMNTLANDVVMAWYVYRLPCLKLLQVGYTAAVRSGLKKIVAECDILIAHDQALPQKILDAQQEMHRYKLRVFTLFPDAPIPDGDGLSSVRFVAQEGWLGRDDLPIDDTFGVQLWQWLENKLGPHMNLPGSMHRIRLLGYDTQEACNHVACHQHYAEPARQWLDAKLISLRRPST